MEVARTLIHYIASSAYINVQQLVGQVKALVRMDQVKMYERERGVSTD